MTDPQSRTTLHHVLATNKGGVGKSLWALELAAALARRGRRVLVVDVDPQANVTRRLRIALDDDTPTINTCLQLGKPATIAIQPCGWDCPEADLIDVLPADIDLELRALEAGAPGAVLRLRKVMAVVNGHYDDAIYDCPPSLGHLTQMAIASAGKDGRVYLPLVPEKDAIRGAQRTRTFVEEYAEALYALGIDIRAVLVNQVDGRTVLHRQRISELPGVFGKSEITGNVVAVWEPYIPRQARIAELHDEGRPSSTDSDLRRAGVVEGFDGIAERMVVA